uniref:Transmembrane protein n=1 Tax=Steinernema glaseri TaxID=37863 RepID=A0A1I7Y9C8_9BILA
MNFQQKFSSYVLDVCVHSVVSLSCYLRKTIQPTVTLITYGRNICSSRAICFAIPSFPHFHMSTAGILSIFLLLFYLFLFCDASSGSCWSDELYAVYECQPKEFLIKAATDECGEALKEFDLSYGCIANESHSREIKFTCCMASSGRYIAFVRYWDDAHEISDNLNHY